MTATLTIDYQWIDKAGTPVYAKRVLLACADARPLDTALHHCREEIARDAWMHGYPAIKVIRVSREKQPPSPTPYATPESP